MKSIIALNHSNYVKELDDLIELHHKSKVTISNLPITAIIASLSSVAPLWKKGSVYYNKAKTYLEVNSNFSTVMDEHSLDIISDLLSKESLEKRVTSEFKNLQCLDEFGTVDGYEGKIFYAPLGVLLHVTAGNVFLGCIDSILMGLLTKNISLVKLSSKNQYLPSLFLESLVEADTDKILCPYIELLTWKGGDEVIENHIKNKVSGIIAWGGEDMVKSYSKDLAHNVKFIQHGPKISFQIISKKMFDTGELDFNAIAKDICMWDQSACANSQNIFLEVGIDVNIFSSKLKMAFDEFTISRGKVDPDEFVELLKDEQEGLYQEFLTGNSMIKGRDFQIVFDHGFLTPTALNRSIKLKKYQDINSLSIMLQGFSFYLQTCGLGVLPEERKKYLKYLCIAGVNRFTKIGMMLESIEGSPHDGNLALVELTKICADEAKMSFQDFINENDAPFYNKFSNKKLSNLPLVDGEILAKHSLVKDKLFLSPKAESGYVYSSGGTTGDPKYCFYSYKEFKKVSELLGESYLGLGLKKGEHVANLFMAGNMWSSFNAVQEALAYCNVIQYPMGGHVEALDFKKYIENFNIKILFGLPSLLISLANEVKDLQIEKIFYAGESFTEEGANFIKNTWGNPSLHSAGYASVDVGPIGYETPDCEQGEHYIFSDLIHLEVINEEAVVTSKIREMMPVIRYKTGDRVKILSEANGKIKFKLLGRVDSKINIWSTRFEKKEVQELLNDFLYNGDFQIQLEKKQCNEKYFETIKVVCNSETKIPTKEFIDQFYRKLKDVSGTIKRDFLDDKVELVMGELIHNERTGKTKDIIDLR